jgi:hypothetical protein
MNTEQNRMNFGIDEVAEVRTLRSLGFMNDNEAVNILL